MEQCQLDYRAGVIAAVLANVNRDSKQRSEPYEPADFFPRLRAMEPPKPPMTGAQMAEQLKQITVALGGTIKE